MPVLCGTNSPRRAATPEAQLGERGFGPGAEVEPRIHLIWPGQQEMHPGMLSSGRGGAASCASLFSCHANVCLRRSLTLAPEFSHAQLNRCSPSLPTLLLTGVPKQLWPPHVSSAQGETSLAGAVPWGWDPRATRGVLLGNITAHYLILAARDAKSLSYQSLMLSQVWVQPPSP